MLKLKQLQLEYTEQPLGRPAVFLLPSDKMGTVILDGKSCRDVVESFLSTEYGGFTDEGNSHLGYWRNVNAVDFHDRYQKYQVSFRGKDRIPKLKSFLAFLANALEEEAIFLQTGEDSCLILPVP